MQINLHKEMSHLNFKVDPLLHKDLIDHAACHLRRIAGKNLTAAGEVPWVFVRIKKSSNSRDLPSGYLT
jgi:hypothetical protein